MNDSNKNLQTSQTLSLQRKLKLFLTLPRGGEKFVAFFLCMLLMAVLVNFYATSTLNTLLITLLAFYPIRFLVTLGNILLIEKMSLHQALLLEDQIILKRSQLDEEASARCKASSGPYQKLINTLISLLVFGSMVGIFYKKFESVELVLKKIYEEELD